MGEKEEYKEEKWGSKLEKKEEYNQEKMECGNMEKLGNRRENMERLQEEM